MKRRLVIRPVARLELAAGADWYDSNRQGLGGEFIRAFEAAAAAITENPFQYQVIYRNARRAPVGQFSYGLIYTVSDDEIVVLSCFHGRRNPRRWQDRIPE
jgi:hypothetical protein